MSEVKPELCPLRVLYEDTTHFLPDEERICPSSCVGTSKYLDEKPLLGVAGPPVPVIMETCVELQKPQFKPLDTVKFAIYALKQSRNNLPKTEQ